MNITVLGATGRTGNPLVAELLRRGHTLTALVRDPARLGPVADRIRVVIGESPEFRKSSKRPAGSKWLGRSDRLAIGA